MQMQIEEQGDKLCIIYGETGGSQKTQIVKNVNTHMDGKGVCQNPKKSIK